MGWNIYEGDMVGRVRQRDKDNNALKNMQNEG